MTSISAKDLQPEKNIGQNSQTILQRIGSGDKNAAQEFVDVYGGLVWAVAGKYTDSREEAEKSVPRIFAEIWRSAKNYNAEMCAESSWIAMIARRKLNEDASRNFGGDASITSKSARQLNAFLELKRSFKNLTFLRPKQRELLEITFSDKTSEKEISQTMELPFEKVKSDVRSVLSEIREKIESRFAKNYAVQQ